MAEKYQTMIFIIGGRGRLGLAFTSFYSSKNYILLDRNVYQNWWNYDSQDKIIKFFEPWAGSSSMILITAGVLDPNLSEDDHMRINYLLPKNIIIVATKFGLKVVTFGTIMENLLIHKNFYVQSKAMLGKYVAEISGFMNLVAHFRIHTLYGLGSPSPFMFLGQIFHSLIYQVPFKMTSGHQLREYHHVEDAVLAMNTLITNGVSSTINLSHGQPVSLKEIATSIFSAFHADNLLHLGALPEPLEENYNVIFKRHNLLNQMHFRNTLRGVVEYMKSCATSKTEICI